MTSTAPWLIQPSYCWPSTPKLADNLGIEEMRLSTVNVVEVSSESELFTRYSSLSRLVRATALILRMVERLAYRWNLCKINGRVPNLRTDKRYLLLSVSELNIAMNTVTQLSQKTFFPQDYKMLALGVRVLKSSLLLSLRPFLDPFGCIRVGGRIQRSFLSYEEKHSLVLSKLTHLSRL